jgi:hypothetical protein
MVFTLSPVNRSLYHLRKFCSVVDPERLNKSTDLLDQPGSDLVSKPDPVWF